MSEETVTWLTQEAYDRLAGELEHLSTHGREEITERIAAARAEGDLKENGGYHAAKDEQGKREARIRQLTELLKHAQVGHAPQSSGVVERGTVVTAEIAGSRDKFLVGSREIAGDSNLSVYSEQSPLGVAIVGLKVGEAASYTAPNGKDISVKILDVETWRGA